MLVPSRHGYVKMIAFASDLNGNSDLTFWGGRVKQGKTVFVKDDATHVGVKPRFKLYVIIPLGSNLLT